MANNPIKIIVVDTSPLISLAAANSLDYLLYPHLPVIIPDAVFYEATFSGSKLGAQEILDWRTSHRAEISIEPTRVFEEAYALLTMPDSRQRPRDVGERAAIEVIRHSHLLEKNDKAILLADDQDVKGMIALEPERIILMTTTDFLRELETAKRIQSAQYVIDLAAKAGRNLPVRDLYSQHDPEIRDAVRDIIQNAHKAKKGED